MLEIDEVRSRKWGAFRLNLMALLGCIDQLNRQNKLHTTQKLKYEFP